MKKIAVLYWSGTGNTEIMAKKIAEGALNNKTIVELMNIENASNKDIINSDLIAIGCPAMGAEELEDSEMIPFIESIKDYVSNKKIALFGSYGWGDGTWINDWKIEMEGYGAIVVLDSLMINETPNEKDIVKCRLFGENLSKL